MADRNELTTPNGEERPQRSVVPLVDVFEDAGGITLLADMPGVPKEALEVRIDGDTLVIAGTLAPLTPEGLRPLWAEVNVPQFKRTFTLSRELDTAKIAASLKEGVLNLRIPKQEHAQPRRIAVNAG
jgi:HSP20 family protein